MTTHFDVIIVGAGISGVCAAYHLQRVLPGKSFAILEARDAIGGTWDLFRYPGIRSDSDMFTLGYPWRPWPHTKIIADGGSIKQYVEECAVENGIEKKIRFGERVRKLSWSSERNAWSVECETAHGRTRYSTSFVIVGTGYYSYDSAYTPKFEGASEFQGRVVHPQFWSDDIDYAGKRVVVIGSGATAVSLVPALAEKAAHVTMLQRSPSYVFSAPSDDPMVSFLRKHLSERTAYLASRWLSVVANAAFFKLSRTWPKLANRMLIQKVEDEVGASVDVSKHFTPRYNVWDQRVCLIPDADLFQAFESGRASIVTDRIERFTRDGIKLENGETLPADLVVTATGLELQMFGGSEIEVDGQRIDISEKLVYKGCMFSDLPNLGYFIGYTNASWTLKCDMTARWLCRLLAQMEQRGAQRCVPRHSDKTILPEPLIPFTSGYIQRGNGRLPSQGSKLPFKVYQNYLLDRLVVYFAKIDDGFLEFSDGPSRRESREPTRRRAAAV